MNSPVLFYGLNRLLNSSNETPLVSGIIKRTKSNCKTIINAKNAKTGPGPTQANKNGIDDGIIQAKTQCTEEPKDCPEPLKWFGKISDIKTQMMAPCPMAWDAMNKKRNIGTASPCQLKIKAHATSDKDII